MNSFIFLNVIPVPRDLMLPLPLFEEHIKILLVLFFLLHIFFVNLMVGGSLLTVIFEILGFRKPVYDRVAKKIAETVTVNKSLAVVLGIGPLLCISLVYTVQFYSANVLTGHAWWAIIPRVTAAFLLTYLHKYSWDSWGRQAKLLHVCVGALASLFFLLIPFIFLSNINLMLFPERWSEVKGFFSSLKIGNVLPRYFHFLAASFAATGLFLTGWFGRASYAAEKEFPGMRLHEIRKLFYSVVLYATLSQFLIGPLVYFTLPARGITPPMIGVILCGVFLAGILLYFLSKEFVAPDQEVGKYYWRIAAVFSMVVFFMGTGRHLYREASLYQHKKMIQVKTEEFRALEYAAQMRISAGLGAGRDRNLAPDGKMIFTQNCAACHTVDKVLVGPPLREIHGIYRNNPAGIVVWAKNPGKKRPGYPQMASMAHLGDEKLKLVAQYMLEAGSGDSESSSAKLGA